MKSVLLLGFNWCNSNAIQTQGSCLHKNPYCYNERVISFPKHLFMLKLRMKLLLVLDEDTFREAFLKWHQLETAQDLKSIFQDPSFQAASFPYFFHYSLKSYLPFIIPYYYTFFLFLSPCILHGLSVIMQILSNTEGKGDSRVASPSLDVSKSHLKPWLTWSSAGDTGTSSGSLE